MIRLEAYVDSSNKLKISVFNNSQYESKILEGREVQELIKQLYTEKILDINENQSEISFRFKDGVLNINEFEKLVRNDHFKQLFMPIFLNAKKAEEGKNVHALKNKKVKRKNKYTAKRIIVGGIAALTLLTVSTNTINAMNIKDNSGLKSGYTQVMDYLESSKNIIDSFNEKLQINDINGIDSEIKKNNPEISELPSEEEAETVSLSYSDRTSSDKAYIADSNYRSVVEKYSKMYGLDPNLMLAIATQETGDHYSNIDSGPAVGLMQIEKSVWESGGFLSAYNFNTESWETIEVSEDNYEQFIDDLKDLDYNVKIGCMIFQESLRNSDYNILAALQTYNMGYGNMHYTILPAYCSDVNKNEEEVLSNQYDTGWLEYRNLVEDGDNNYIENVLSYYGDNCDIEVIRPDGTKVSVNVDNSKLNKVY